MAKAGEEDTIRECDANISIYYRMAKQDKLLDAELDMLYHEEEMNKSLDRRNYLMERQKVAS